MLRKSNLGPLSMLFAVTLAACGGGGGGGSGSGSAAPAPAPAPAPAVAFQGAYSGVLSGSSSQLFQLLVLDDGSFWALYGGQAGSTFAVRGFLQGTATQTNGSLSSSDVKDFGATPPLAGTLSGTISSSMVNGSVSANGATVGFTGPALGPSNSTYDYNAAASIGSVTGPWTLTGLDGTTTSVTVATDGAFSGTNAGCSISGRLTPRSSGKNVFDVTVTSGAAPCVAPGSTSNGVAVTYLLAGSSTRELIVAGVNSGRTGGNAFFGTR